MNTLLQRFVKAIRNKPVDAQIKVYQEVVRRRGQMVSDLDWIEQFCQQFSIDNLEDSTDIQVAEFLDVVADKYKTEYAIASARRAIMKVRRYFLARAKKVDRRTHWDMVEKVKELRDREGLSFRAIGDVLGRDVRQIHRWYTYDAKQKLSTE